MGVQSVISRVVMVAGGRFAPGHLGELTRLVPFEMVDEALAETGRVQRRVRDLPSRVVVYLLLAACLFPELGYPGVWRELTAGLAGLQAAAPTAGALAQARRRVGPEPLRFLFGLLRGPAAVPPGRGAWWHGLLVCAIDGTILTVPDTPANLARFAKGGSFNGGTGYPQVRLRALVACGTRTVIDAVFGPTSKGETTYAPGLPALRRCPDGSCLSSFGGLPVWVIDARVTVATAAGQRAGHCRLVTTLLDDRRHPAGSLIELYHERWEIETAYLELKSTILRGRVLRARTPAGLTQEIYALLVTYQVMRTAMADAAGTRPGRVSFTIAWQAARNQVTSAAGVIAGDAADLAGTIGRRALAALLPARRLRTSLRIVKRAISKYQARGSGTDRTSYNATLSIEILTRQGNLTIGISP